jgi:hypothetical protein
MERGMELNKEQKELDNRIRKEGWLKLDDLTLEYAELSATIHVDTRDFHVNFSFEQQLEENASLKFRKEITDNKKVDYLTFNEVLSRLKEWKQKSGGDIGKRLIFHDVWGWFKYVRIFKTEKGYVWCSSISDEYRFFTNRNLEKNMDFEPYGE